MKTWLGPIGFLAIAALVLGGLGWATRAALSLERQQLEQQAAAELADKARLALWRLDSRLTALLAVEDARPFSHYSTVHVPQLALSNVAQTWPVGSVLEPSPLLSANIEAWMLLHFQADAAGWESPQVLTPRLEKYLRRADLKVDLGNVTPERRKLLDRLGRDLPTSRLLAAARRYTGPAVIENRVMIALRNSLDTQNAYDTANWRDYAARAGTQSKIGERGRVVRDQTVEREIALLCHRNGEEWLNPRLNQLGLRHEQQAVTRLPTGAEVSVRMSPLTGAWIPAGDGKDLLVLLRLVKLEEREVCQGIVLDGAFLSCLLAEEVQDLLPDARIRPVRDPSPDQLLLSMTTLPFHLDPGAAPAPEDSGWTGLRVGLLLSWIAALVALLAVGLGGWGLLALSASRVRFVSAVTHELRTPLTTLRLYLDMLLGGMVRDEGQRQEYMRTLHAETDRLSRLVANVLDFSRLENQSPRLVLAPLDMAALLSETESAWRIRCETAHKELVLENDAPTGAVGKSDLCLLSQVLGNLLDNACKYTRDAEDRRLWLRARVEGGKAVFEVEDRGPGIPAAERGTVFRAFQRGLAASEATGGVGLGLALATRWVRLLGGTLTLRAPAEGGTCFRVEVPLASV